MLLIAIGLIVIAAVAFIAEMFIPGFGVFGIGGIVCLLAGILITVIYTPYGFLAALIEVLVIAGLVAAFVRYARKRRGLTALVLNDELKDSGLNTISETIVGAKGATVTPLKPFGVAEIDGKRIEVTSEGELIAANVPVSVISVKDGKVFVKSE